MSKIKVTLIVVFNTLVLLGTVELYFRWNPGQSRPIEALQKEITSFDAPYLRGIDSSRFVGLAPRLELIRSPLDTSLRYEDGYTYLHKDVNGQGYYAPSPNRVYKSVERTADGKLVYDIEYQIDEFSRRFVHSSDPKASYALALLGCSFVYGEGVDNSESLPFYLHQYVPQANVYNLGFHGNSIANFLYQVQEIKDHPFYKDIVGKKRIAIYVFQDFHLDRFFGTTRLFKQGWGYKLPWFDWSAEKRQFVFMGRFKERYSLFHRALTFFSKTATAQALRSDFPLLKKQSTDEYAQAILEVRRLLQEKKGFDDLLVVASPFNYDPLSEKVVHSLKQNGVTVFDYSKVSIIELLKGNQSLAYDGHPSGYGNDLLAQLIARDWRRWTIENPATVGQNDR